jgi:hypothetical protein
MPVKSFTFAFKLDAKELLEYVVNRNVAIDIHATGTRRQEVEQLSAPEQPLALPSPPQKTKARDLNPRTNSRGVVLAYMSNRSDEKHSVSALRALIEQAGFSGNTLHGMLFIMLKAGLIRKAGKGHYRIASKGRRMMEEA